MFGKRPPTVNLSHVDLTGSEPCPKQHRGHRLRLDPSPELFVQTLGRVRQQVPVLRRSAALDRHAISDRGDGLLQSLPADVLPKIRWISLSKAPNELSRLQVGCSP